MEQLILTDSEHIAEVIATALTLKRIRDKIWSSEKYVMALCNPDQIQIETPSKISSWQLCKYPYIPSSINYKQKERDAVPGIIKGEYCTVYYALLPIERYEKIVRLSSTSVYSAQNSKLLCLEDVSADSVMSALSSAEDVSKSALAAAAARMIDRFLSVQNYSRTIKCVTPRNYMFLAEKSLTVPLALLIKSINLTAYTIVGSIQGLEVFRTNCNSRNEAESIVSTLPVRLQVAGFSNQQSFIRPKEVNSLSSIFEDAEKINIPIYICMETLISLYAKGLIRDPFLPAAEVCVQEIQKKLIRIAVSDYSELNITARYLLSNPICEQEAAGIIPTCKSATELTGDERKVYTLVVRRYLEMFLPPVLISTYKFSITDGSNRYYAKQDVVLNEGWQGLEGIKRTNQISPLLTQKSYIVDYSLIKNKQGITRVDLYRSLENLGIGTAASRIDAIKLLEEYKYIEADENSILRVTPLGQTCYQRIMDTFPRLLEPDYAQNCEQGLSDISNSTLSCRKYLYTITSQLKTDIEMLKDREQAKAVV